MIKMRKKKAVITNSCLQVYWRRKAKFGLPSIRLPYNVDTERDKSLKEQVEFWITRIMCQGMKSLCRRVDGRLSVYSQNKCGNLFDLITPIFYRTYGHKAQDCITRPLSLQITSCSRVENHSRLSPTNEILVDNFRAVVS